MTTLSQLAQRLPFSIERHERLAYALIALWSLGMMGLPISRWIWGDTVIPAAITLSAALQVAVVFTIVRQQWGFRRTAFTFGIVMMTTWIAEALGSRTGFPFGDYHYTQTLQPQVGGVPILVPMAWFMLLPSAWLMAQHIVGTRHTWRHKLAFIAMSAIALTAWDLFLDPQMVAWDFWVWQEPSGYFGIPFSNYAGWLLVAAVVTLIANPPQLNGFPLALIYGMVCFFQTFGQAFFWNQAGPVFFGAIGMMSVMLLAYWQHRRRQATDS